MADFHKAFEAIDEDGSGEITVDELQHYMMKNNYKESFVSKWLTLFDGDKSGKISYKHYCDTLGLVPREREVPMKTDAKPTDEDMIEPVKIANENAELNNTKKPLEKKVIKPQSYPIQKPTDEDMIEPVKIANENAELNNTKKALEQKVKKPQSYPIQNQKKVSKRRKKLFSKHKRCLRARIQPGVVLILLTGAHRGKRVIFLKQLTSGLLLVTGPFKFNGCPLRRVHQKMVIATSTKLDIDDVLVPDRLTDEYFAREETNDEKKMNSDVNNIFAKSKKHYVLKEIRKEDQKDVDGQIINSIKKRSDKSMLKRYLKSLFTLSAHDYPHKMQF